MAKIYSALSLVFAMLSTASLPQTFTLLSFTGAGAANPRVFCAGQGRFVVRIDLGRVSVYRGQELGFIRDGRKICILGNSLQSDACQLHFVGVARSLSITVARDDHHPIQEMNLHERVTVTGKDGPVPDLPVFEKTITLADGVGSDLQAFGYDEDSVPASQRHIERDAFERAWVVYHQELTLAADPTPFAVLDWRHTARDIKLIKVVR